MGTRKFHLPVVILFLSALFFSCGNDELKAPTKISFKFDMDDETQSHLNSVEFDNGRIEIENFSFNGQREEGDDVYFTRNFSNGLLVNLDSGQPSELSFEIPQGVYTNIRVSFSTTAIQNDAHLRVEGSFTEEDETEKSVIFDLDVSLSLVLTAINQQGLPDIVLKKENDYTPLIVFDPSICFEPITDTMLVNAVSINDTVFINPQQNTSLYLVIMGRINNSFKIIFE